MGVDFLDVPISQRKPTDSNQMPALILTELLHWCYRSIEKPRNILLGTHFIRLDCDLYSTLSSRDWTNITLQLPQRAAVCILRLLDEVTLPMVKSVELIATEKSPSREGSRTCACFLLRQSQISHSAPLDPVIYDLGLHSSECYPTEAESLVPGSLTMIDALLSSSYLVLAISKIPRDRTCFGQSANGRLCPD